MSNPLIINGHSLFGKHFGKTHLVITFDKVIIIIRHLSLKKSN